MKLVITLSAVVALASPLAAQRTHTVRGHVRADGTYVAPHVRTNPDASRTNNWSSSPNVNPYTGRTGTVDPYAPRPRSTSRPFGS